MHPPDDSKPSSPFSTHSVTLRTPRLLLRAARPSDLQAMHSLLSNDQVMRYWSGPPFTSIDQSQKYLANMLESPNNGTLDFVLVLVHRPTADSSSSTSTSLQRIRGRSTVIGKAGIWTPMTTIPLAENHHPRGPEIGLLLHPGFWSQGYMYEALQALLPHFRREGVANVIADVDPRNGRSLGLLRRSGFVEVGREERTIWTHLGWCDSVFLELGLGVRGREREGAVGGESGVRSGTGGGV